MATSTTPTGVHEGAADASEGIGDFDAFDFFLKDITGDPNGSTQDDGTEAGTEGTTEAPERTRKTTEEANEGETGNEGQEDPAQTPEGTTETETTAADRRQAADDDEVIVQIGDESKRVSVKDLKRLFGQEAALTQRGQAAAEQRKALDVEAQKYNTGLTKMAEEAKGRWNEYEKIDYLLAKDAMTPEAFAKLRDDAQKAFQADQYFQKEIGEFAQVQAQRQQAALRENAIAATKAILDPAHKAHIPGWNDDVYNGIRKFAIQDMGAPAEVINTVTDPWALKVLHMAAEYAKAQKTIGKEAPKPRPVVKTSPSKVMTTKETSTNTGSDRRATAMKRLSSTGDIDDAAAAFLAGWDTE